MSFVANYSWCLKSLVSRLDPNCDRLIVKCGAGMCNRLFFLLTAASFAQKYRLELYVDWTDGLYGEKGEDAFSRLFSFPGAQCVSELSGVGKVFPTEWQHAVKEKIHERLAALNIGLDSQLQVHDLFVPFHHILASKSVGNTVVVCGWGEQTIDLLKSRVLYQRRRQAAKLKPSDLVKAELEKWKKQVIGAIGVHVRRTDAPNQVPTSKYVEAIGSSKQKIFLCTDSAVVEHEFREIFRGRLLSVARTYCESNERLHLIHRSTEEKRKLGVEAARDLFLLSRCSTIVTASNSSFSRFATDAIASRRAKLRRI